ncbi:MAG: nucleoside monophosphate kinase [Candidatus Lokiarchaeota archaeon]|nr:nucleoside monophosphate kinase [Candidatus Lokiarchaeota archaeon]
MVKKKHIILLGPPGAGKGTFSYQIKKIIPDINHISTGDIFRENITNSTPLGLKAKEYIERGELVPDEITNNMIKNRLEEIDHHSWILDGYPRNIGQAKYLSEIVTIDLVLLLSVDDEIIKKRILGRFICSNCNKIYNKYTLLPKKEINTNHWICDDCGKDIVFKQRTDDTEETLNKRLDVYRKNTEPLVKFYKEKKKLKTINAKNTLGYSDKEIKEFLEI